VRVRTSAKKSSPRHPSERRAAWWYRRRGYRVLAANAWAGGYELDLVVRRGRVLVFVEVKSKAGPRYGDPLEMVTPLKVERLRRAAGAWLASNRGSTGLRLRFDVAAERAGRLEVVQDAF
jgi:putative endonuclease